MFGEKCTHGRTHQLAIGEKCVSTARAAGESLHPLYEPHPDRRHQEGSYSTGCVLQHPFAYRGPDDEAKPGCTWCLQFAPMASLFFVPVQVENKALFEVFCPVNSPGSWWRSTTCVDATKNTNDLKLDHATSSRGFADLLHARAPTKCVVSVGSKGVAQSSSVFSCASRFAMRLSAFFARS